MNDETGLDDELDTLWRGLRVELVAETDVGRQLVPAPRRRRARRRLYVGAGLAALSLAAAGGATGKIFIFDHARTGTYSHPAYDSGSGEWLEESARDMPEVARSISRDIPFAPGYKAYQDFTYNDYLTSDHQNEITQSAARAEIADQAICSWVDYWVGSDRAGDGQARAAATRTLTASLHWSAVTTADPHPDPRGQVGNDGELIPTRFGYLPGVVQAAQGTDAKRVAESLFDHGSTYCVPEQLRAIDGPKLLDESDR
jgi:hypothetical protein